MRVSIVILTYQRCASVLRLLRGLARLNDPDCEVVVVDNGSDDGSSAAIAAEFPHVALVTLPENCGVGARNRGLETARGEIVISLDDDMGPVSDDDLAYLRRRFAAESRLAGLCFKVTWPDSDRVRDWVHRRPSQHADESFPTYEITEGAVAWRCAAVVEVGLYREDFFISHEGLELAYRLLDAGWDIVYDGQVTISHDHATDGRAHWRRHYYDTRNLFWVAALHQPASYTVRYLGVGVAAMGVYAVRDWHLLAWVRGVGAGLQRVPQMLQQRSVWSARTRRYVAEADSWRPGFWTMVRKRLGEREFSMD